MIQLVIHLVIHHQRKTVQHVSMVETGPASYSGRRWNDRLPSDLCWCTPEVSSMSPPSACHWQCARHRWAPLRCCFEWRFAVLVFHGFLFGVDLSDFNSCGSAGCVFVFFDFNWFMIIKLIDPHHFFFCFAIFHWLQLMFEWKARIFRSCFLLSVDVQLMFSIFVVLNQLIFMNLPMLFCLSFFRIQVYLNSQYWFLSLFSNGRVTFFLPFHLNKCLPCPLHQKNGMMSRLTARYNLNPMTHDWLCSCTIQNGFLKEWNQSQLAGSKDHQCTNRLSMPPCAKHSICSTLPCLTALSSLALQPFFWEQYGQINEVVRGIDVWSVINLGNFGGCQTLHQ